jgi:hypothetical protein
MSVLRLDVLFIGGMLFPWLASRGLERARREKLVADREWFVLHRWTFSDTWFAASLDEQKKVGKVWQAVTDKWKAAGVERLLEIVGPGGAQDGYSHTTIWKIAGADQYADMLRASRSATDVLEYVEKWQFELGWRRPMEG